MSNLSLIPSREEIEVLQVIAKAAAESQHLGKMGGYSGIFSIALYAKELGVPVMTALYGGLQNIQGKITMSAELMNNLIRQRGHSIEIAQSNDEICRIKGTRRDTKESYEAAFSFQDAQRAGLVKSGGGWEKYPSAMLFARCISRLAKRLFPDVIGGAYVEGELDEPFEEKKTKNSEEKHKQLDSKVIPMSEPQPQMMNTEVHSVTKNIQEEEEELKMISAEDCQKIEALIIPSDKIGDDCYRTQLLKYFSIRYKLNSCNEFSDIPEKALKSIYKSVHSRNQFMLNGVAEEKANA